MARVLRADQVPKSATPFEPVGSNDVVLEDFDTSGAGNGFSRTSGASARSSPGGSLADNIIKAAELQAEEILTRAKDQADRQLEKAQTEVDRAAAEAEEIIAQAQAEALRLQEQARQEIDKARQAAQSEGYERGQGLAIQERNAEIDHLIQALQNAIDATPAFKEKLIAQYEAEILELALVIATKIVGFELSIHPDLIFEVVKGGIELLKDKREISISLSPGDLELVRQYRPELLRQVEGAGQIYLIADENLITGECLIENKSNLVDSTWRRKISNAAEMVWELYNQRDVPEQDAAINATTPY